MQFTRILFSVGVLLVSAIPAVADVYNFTNFDNISSGGSFTGSVEVTQVTTDQVKIDVEGNFDWASTGAGSGDQFFFNIKGTTAASPAPTVLSITSGYKLSTQTPFTIPGDGFTDLFAYAIVCDYAGGFCNHGGDTGVKPPLVFVLQKTGLTIADFNVSVTDQKGNTGNVFVVDAVTTNGNTGLAGATAGGTIILHGVPDGGATLMLLGCALVGVETLRRKVRT